jgi:hypothetical protein
MLAGIVLVESWLLLELVVECVEVERELKEVKPESSDISIVVALVGDV